MLIIVYSYRLGRNWLPLEATGNDEERSSAPRSARIGLLPEGALFRGPQPTVQWIALQAQRVLAGDVVLPKFQRNFVWSRQQVLELLDSVAWNYPIGRILLWQSTQELASERTIAGLEVAAADPDTRSTTCWAASNVSPRSVVHCTGSRMAIRAVCGTSHIDDTCTVSVRLFLPFGQMSDCKPGDVIRLQ